MAIVTLTCPHCGFTKKLDNTNIPPSVTKVTCPKCQGHFTCQESIKEAPEAATKETPIIIPSPADMPSQPPLSAGPFPAPTPPPHRKSRKKKLLVFAAVSLSILVGTGLLFTAYYMFLENNDPAYAKNTEQKIALLQNGHFLIRAFAADELGKDGSKTARAFDRCERIVESRATPVGHHKKTIKGTRS